MQPHDRLPSTLHNEGQVSEAHFNSHEVKAVMDELQPHPPHPGHDPSPAVHKPASGTGIKLAIFVALLAIALGAGFWYAHHRNAAQESKLAQDTDDAASGAAAVDVVKIAYSAPVHQLTLPGQTEAWFESTIYARVSGYVKSWSKDIGDHVKTGDVLARIDTPDLDQQMIGAQAKVKAEEAQVSVAEAKLDFAKRSQEMWAQSPPGSVSKYEIQSKEADAKSALAELAAAKQQVELDKADVGKLQAFEKFKDVTAPYDGVITARHIDVGDLVTSGNANSTTSFYTIADPGTIRVFVYVPQWASAEIRDKMPASVTTPQFPGRAFAGTVTRTSNAIDPASRTLKVEVDIPNKPWVLMPGMYVEVSFQITEAQPPLRVPASALSFRSSGPTVAVVSKDQTIHFRPVTISRDMGNYVDVSSGVREGDLVGLNISNQIADGDKVSPEMVSGSADGAPQTPSTKATTVVERPSPKT